MTSEKKFSLLNCSGFLIALCAALLLFFLNFSFIIDLYNCGPKYRFFIANLMQLFTTLFLLSSLALINKYVFLITHSFLFFLGSAAAYYNYYYKIVISPAILQMIFTTDVGEVSELINITLIYWLLLYGIAPSILLYYLINKYYVKLSNFSYSLKCFIANISIIILLYLLSFSINGLKHKNIINLMQSIFNFMPFNYIAGVNNYLVIHGNKLTRTKDITEISSHNIDPSIMSNLQIILVIGESARSDHFQINGYQRETTPNLLKIDNLISYPDVSSLATYTVEGLNAILKKQGYEKYSSFISVFNSLGFKTHWLSNQTLNKKKFAANDEIKEATNIVFSEEIRNKDMSIFYDCNVLPFVTKIINNNHPNLIIIHSRGSHRLYDLRYPDEFKKFLPICVDNQSYYHLSECTDLTKLTNSYDNSILYTDYFLAELINIVKDKKVIMIYISDHGESLGEDGAFGHGRVIEKAPRAQTHIPLIIWASDSFLTNHDLAKNFYNAQQNKDKKIDQSFIFNSILDCIDINSNIIDKDKSICLPIK